MKIVGDFGHGEHDHLKGDDHRKDKQIVKQRGNLAFDPYNIPGGHGGKKDDPQYGKYRNKQRIQKRHVKAGFGKAVDIVGKACEGFSIGQGKGGAGDIKPSFKGIDHSNENGSQEYRRKQYQEDNGNPSSQTFCH